MKPRQCLALVVTSVLALGCASANAQDDQGKAPAPAPKADGPKRRPPEGFDADRAKHAMTEHIAAIEKRIAELEKSDVPDKERQITEMRRAADEMRERVEELNRGELPDFAGGAPGPQDEQRMREAVEQMRDAERRAVEARQAVGKLTADGVGPESSLMQEAQRALKDAMAALDRSRDEMAGARLDRFRGGMEFGGKRMQERGERRGRMGRDDRGPGGPGPSVEERLAQLERAVREMHDMFARHDVPPEMRERAEREMRERRGDGGPRRERGEPFAGRPEDGEPRPMDPNGPGRPPVPRPPRVVEANQDAAAALKQLVGAQKDQLAELAKQLADTQEALKKAQAEIDAMKAKQPK